MADKKKPTPRERAKLAASKRRATERAAKGKIFTCSNHCFLFVGVLAVWIVFLIRAVQPPAPFPIGPITAPRVQLSDGRHVAFSEMGASAEEAIHNVLVIHGIRSSRLSLLPNVTNEELKELGIRVVSYDRPGYGQSDPHPTRTAKTEAEDIAEIADLLELGSKFYILGISWGGIPAWASLRYIPKRLRGVAMVNPVPNFWAKSMMDVETYDSWMWFTNPDRISLLVARHVPWLLHFWLTQKVFNKGAWIDKGGVPLLSGEDMEVLSWPEAAESLKRSEEEGSRQGPVESSYRDRRIAFQNWPFDITDIDFSDDADFQGEVHLWQGANDYVVPAPANRYVERVLPSVKYTEIEGKGHLLFLERPWALRIVKELVSLSHDRKTCDSSLDSSCLSEEKVEYAQE